MYVPLIISFLMILGITIFALQNGKPLDVKFLVWELKTSQIAVILGSVLVGAFISSLFSLPLLVKKHFREKRLAKQLREFESKYPGSAPQSQQKKNTDITSSTAYLL